MAVYYLCGDREAPAGGVKVIYRHVDLLNRNGVEAFVLHERPPFRATWFENDTPIVYWLRAPAPRPTLARRVEKRFRGRPVTKERLHLTQPPELELTSADVLVVPEGFGPRLAEIAPGIRKVIFNQNAYRTFHGYPLDIDAQAVPYRSRDVARTIVISEDNRRYLATAFPDIDIRRIHNEYDPLRFPFRTDKRRLVSYMPRKNPFDAEQVLLLLRLTGNLDGWEVAAIDGMSERETAAVLGDSSVFLSFGHPEGCPLPPAEAMLSGAIVVGYHGMGGREYFRDEFAYPIGVGDIQAFAETAASVLRRFESEPEALAEQAQAASRFIRETYTAEREEHDLLEAFRDLVA
jgi:glycosyltransferase involved in cell wall biosynthesis